VLLPLVFLLRRGGEGRKLESVAAPTVLLAYIRHREDPYATLSFDGKKYEGKTSNDAGGTMTELGGQGDVSKIVDFGGMTVARSLARD
jgi:hypothetical protein